MITIVSGTNRPNSSTYKIASKYLQLIEKQGVTAKLLSLGQLPLDIAVADMYGKRSALFQQILNEFIVPTQKIVIVVPEYNGSFPGILKTFIDAMHPDLIRGKKIALVGVSSGRAGNLRGMDHLTGIFHYLGLHVLPDKLPLSRVLTLFDEKGNLNDEYTLKMLEKQCIEFINW
jgi:chromate reductase